VTIVFFPGLPLWHADEDMNNNKRGCELYFMQIIVQKAVPFSIVKGGFWGFMFLAARN